MDLMPTDKYLEDDMTEYLFSQIYMGNSESAILFPSADQYISIIYGEGKFILDNLHLSEKAFNKRFLYPKLGAEQRELIIFSLQYFTDMIAGDLISHIESYRENNPLKLSDVDLNKTLAPLQFKADKLIMIRTLIENERGLIIHRKAFFPKGIEKQLSLINNVIDKISYLKNTILDIKGHVDYELYKVHFANMLRLCRIKIEQLELQNPKDLKIGQSGNLCISEGKIVDLYGLFIEKIITGMDCASFMLCFDLNRIPQQKPSYIHQNTMIYALSLIKEFNSKNLINQKNALQNFGIKNFDSAKSQVKRLYPIEPILKHKIEQILLK